MAKNDITIFDDATYMPGAKRFKVASGTTSSINAGELVRKSLGQPYVSAWTIGVAASALAPEVTTDVLAGLSMTTSTETASAVGEVDVLPIAPGVTYLCSPNDATQWNTQAKYDALVGDRVLLNYAVTTGVFTVLHTDGSFNGCVVEPLDIIKHPGKVRFSLRRALSYTN